MPGKKNELVIWPIYFDMSRSRRGGRMVAAENAIVSPTLDDVITAAIMAGLKPEIEREKKYPKTWYESSGRILVTKDGPKSTVLKKIARSLKKKAEAKVSKPHTPT